MKKDSLRDAQQEMKERMLREEAERKRKKISPHDILKPALVKIPPVKPIPKDISKDFNPNESYSGFDFD